MTFEQIVNEVMRAGDELRESVEMPRYPHPDSNLGTRSARLSLAHVPIWDVLDKIVGIGLPCEVYVHEPTGHTVCKTHGNSFDEEACPEYNSCGRVVIYHEYGVEHCEVEEYPRPTS